MQLEQIRQIAVIGLGRMGHGIAQCFAMGGYQVRGFDDQPAARASLHQRVRSNLEAFVAVDLLDAAEVEPTLARIEIADSEAAAASEAQFVVEAILEDRAAKQAFFQRIEAATAESTILASNSSTFTISDSGSLLQHPERAIITHWFNPPHVAPTVEIVPGPATSAEVAQTTVALHKKIGKMAVLVNQEIPGFLVNRVQMAMIREVWDLYERGIASAADIDAAIRGSLGFRLAAFGPLAICDFGGVNIWATVYQGLAPDLRSDAQLPPSIASLLEAGRLGVSAGAGIHDYDPTAIDQVVADRDQKMLKLAKLLHDIDHSPES